MPELPDFIEFLKDRLKSPLPGYDAHSQMEPMMNNKHFRPYTPKDDTRSSAVLVLLTLNKETHELEVMLTLRSTNISHSGQISCLGGLSETGEEPYITALREAKEEVGLYTDNINIIGNLSNLYVQPSNSLISPVLAYVDKIKDLTINKSEVEEVFFVKLNTLLDDRVFKREIWNLKGNDVEVPFWNIHKTTPLWGATAMILKELLVLFSEYNVLKLN
ncbi:MAG: CoA pyrophosphatase [Bacteroidetes bacterium]|nr:CoA pyrophosphatase [Bacteroidota bacterium]